MVPQKEIPEMGVMVRFWIIKGSAKSWLKDFV
jgi:hypothetical protein